MNKMMMAVAGLAMAVVLTGCGGSPKGVAEDFVEAIIQKDGDKAVACLDTTDKEVFTEKAIKSAKEYVEKLGKSDDINDDKLEAVAVREEIEVPAEDSKYKLLNGKKYTGETATVRVQFVKGKDKKSNGMTINLVKVDGSWKVVMDNYRVEKNFDTSDK